MRFQFKLLFGKKKQKQKKNGEIRDKREVGFKQLSDQELATILNQVPIYCNCLDAWYGLKISYQREAWKILHYHLPCVEISFSLQIQWYV